MELRLATLPEVDIVYEMCEKIKKSYPIWNDEYPTYDIFIDDFRNNSLFVLIVKNEIVGSISIEDPVTNNATSIYLSRLMVDIKHRRKGYAKTIFKAIEEIMRFRGYKTIEFLVSSQHPFGDVMYPKLGYKNQGRFEVPWPSDGYYNLYTKNISE